jgi:hypothetical protein
VLVAHVGCAFATVVVQTFPQLPQLLRSLVRSSHSVGTPVAGHALRPAAQLRPQVLDLHAAVPLPFVGPGHVLPQAPQLAGSLVSSTHAVGAPVGQALKPLLQLKEHALDLHAGWPLVMPEHTLPQVLQFFASVDVSVQVPLHSVDVGALQPVAQPEASHTGAVDGHAVVHEPQCDGTVMSVSQPLSALPSQLA